MVPMIERYKENVNQLQIDMNKVRVKYQRILVLMYFKIVRTSMRFHEVSKSRKVSYNL